MNFICFSAPLTGYCIVLLFVVGASVIPGHIRREGTVTTSKWRVVSAVVFVILSYELNWQIYIFCGGCEASVGFPIGFVMVLSAAQLLHLVTVCSTQPP